jgi:hypothetical protein
MPGALKAPMRLPRLNVRAPHDLSSPVEPALSVAERGRLKVAQDGSPGYTHENEPVPSGTAEPCEFAFTLQLFTQTL